MASKRENLAKKKRAGASSSPQNSMSRGLAILSISILATAGIIGLVVLLTPLEPMDESDIAQGVKVSDEPLQRLSSGEVDLEFPDQPEAVQTGSLRQELEILADQLQKEDERDPAAFHIAAQIYASLNMTEFAERAWRRSIELRPLAEGPYLGLAEMLNQGGRSAEAIDVLEACKERGYLSDLVDLRLAEAFENEGEQSAARTLLDESIRRATVNPELWLAHGRILNQLGDFSSAESSLKRHLELRPNSEAGLVLLSSCQIRLNKRKEADETQKKIADLKAIASEGKRDFQQTYDESLRSIAIDMFLAAGTLDEEKHRLELAEKRLWRVLKLAPMDGQTCMALAKVFRTQERIGAALQMHRYLLKIQPDNLFNYINLASVAFQMRDIDLARSTLIAALQIDPEGVVAQAALARLESSLANHNDAFRYAELVLQRMPSVESYLLLANVQNAAGLSDLAKRSIDEARKLDPQNERWANDGEQR